MTTLASGRRLGPFEINAKLGEGGMGVPADARDSHGLCGERGSSKRVAVIGAGPSGLVAVKELLDEGHRPTSFERARGIGGVFRFDEEDGVVWESCRLTSSGLLTAFSDFPVGAQRAGHMTAGEYVGYLEEYSAAFGLAGRARFGCEVETVRRAEGDGWRVIWREAGGRHEERFDAVVVCSGLHQHPHRPRIEGLESFAGETMHGSRYRRPEQVAGRRVLVVGAGESGADIAAELSRHAAETVLSLRRGVAVQPRTMFGQPKDLQTSRLLNSPAEWIFQTRHPADDRKRTAYRWLFLPFVALDKLLQLTYRYFWEYLPLLRGGDRREIRSNLRTRELTMQLLAESGGTLNEQFGTKTDDFVRAIADGRCRQAPGVDRFEERRVVFSDGSDFSPDLVILCTGFETRMPFLDEATAAAPRFLHAIHPEIGPSLAFVGFLRPAFGAIPPLAELQARWVARLLSGAAALPPRTEMEAAIARWQRRRAHTFRAVRDRLDYLVDHAVACDELAARIGCKPTRRVLRGESREIRRKAVAGPFVAAQYRLTGPHAKPELARRILSAGPVMHPWPDRANLYLRWFLSRTMYRLLGDEYPPKLDLEEG